MNVSASPAPPSRRRLGTEEQVALYSVFHRNPVNRAIHGATMPVIMVSGFSVLAAMAVARGGAGTLLNLGLLVLVVMIGAFAALDVVTAIGFVAWGAPAWWFGTLLVAKLSLPALLSLNAVVQGAAWYLAVQLGHERFEEWLPVPKNDGTTRALVSSNVYFERRYFLLWNVGFEVSLLESFQQLAISPFAATLDVLFALGYRPSLRARVDSLARVYVARLAQGAAILAGVEARVPGPATLDPSLVEVGAASVRMRSSQASI